MYLTEGHDYEHPDPGLGTMLPCTYLAEVDISHDYEDSGMLSIRYPCLLPSQDPVLAILLGPSLQRKGIGTTAGLRQTVTSDLKDTISLVASNILQ